MVLQDLGGKSCTSRYSFDSNNKTKIKGATRTKRPTQTSQVLFSLEASFINFDLDSDESSSDVEIGRNCNIIDFHPPDHYTEVSGNPITSMPSVKTNVRPTSAATMSSESCYSLASAASLSPLITSDIFVVTVTAPSMNASAIGAPSADRCGTLVKPEILSSSLADRRGFKGAPLFTTKTGSFPSFPVVLSPKALVSPPGSGFVTTMSNLWASSPKTGTPANCFCFPAHIQEDVDRCDPFSTAGPSYFSPHLEDSSFSWSDIQDDLYDFSIYFAIAERKPDFLNKMNRRKQDRIDLLSRSPTESTDTRINICDTSISDICSKDYAKGISQSTGILATASKAVTQTEWFSQTAFVNSPHILLTPPSVPSSPRRQYIEDTSPTVRSIEAVASARSSIAEVSSAGQMDGDITSLLELQENTGSRNCLRPLILSSHVAKRNSPPVPYSSFEVSYPLATSTPVLSPRDDQLPTIFETPSTESYLASIESIHAQPSSTPSSDNNFSTNSSTDRRRSRAMVDILSLLDAAVLNAAEALDAIDCEEDSVDLSGVSLVGFHEMVTRAV